VTHPTHPPASLPAIANPKASIPRTIRPKKRHRTALLATADELAFDWNFERWVYAFIAQYHAAQRDYIELRVTNGPGNELQQQ